MTAQKHTPVRIWCAPEGEYGQGFDAVRLCTWSDRQEYRDGFETQYVRADIADEMLDALKMVMQHGRIDDSEERMSIVGAAIAKAEAVHDSTEG